MPADPANLDSEAKVKGTWIWGCCFLWLSCSEWVLGGRMPVFPAQRLRGALGPGGSLPFLLALSLWDACFPLSSSLLRGWQVPRHPSCLSCPLLLATMGCSTYWEELRSQRAGPGPALVTLLAWRYPPPPAQSGDGATGTFPAAVCGSLPGALALVLAPARNVLPTLQGAVRVAVPASWGCSCRRESDSSCSVFQILQQAGQVWLPDSAYKTAQVINDFNREKLPLMIFANWRGFSGGTKGKATPLWVPEAAGQHQDRAALSE